MASIYDLKPAFQSLLRPLSRYLVKLGCTPNSITLSAACLSLMEGLCITFFPHAHWPLLLLPVVLLIRMIMNALDGMIAREHQMQSRLGTFLNELGDVVSDTCLYLPFALLPGIYPSLIVFIVIFAIMAEMAGVVAIQAGAERRYDGPMGKSDRAFVFGFIGLLLGSGWHIDQWINYFFGVICILLIITIINRVIHGLRDANK